MNAEKTSTLQDWIFFLISLAAMIALLTFKPEFFWLALPFVGTFLAKALRAM